MTAQLLGIPTLRPPLYTQPRERYLYLYPTTVCGLRCRHCYVGSDRLDAGNTMSVAFAEQVMDYFKVTGGHDKLYLLGGEPTLHPQLAAIVASARERGYSVTISSNGDFDDEVFDVIGPDMLASFNFSLESADPAIHRRIRGNPHNYAKVTGHIRRAAELGYQVRVMCTVSQENAERALDLIGFVADLGGNTLSFHNLGLTGNAARFLKPLPPAEWMEFCRALEAYPPDPRVAVYYPPTFVPFDEQPKWADRGYPGCPARSLDRPHIYPDGTVYACPLLMDGQRHYAQFQDGQLRLNPSPDSELNAYLSADPGCTGCPATGTCGGGCPAYAAMPAYGADGYSCDRDVTPLCILWTTYAWGQQPAERLHAFR